MPSSVSISSPKSLLTAELAAHQQARRSARRNARWAARHVGRALAREAGEEAASSLTKKLPLGVGAAVAAGFAVRDLRKARKLDAIAADPERSDSLRDRARAEAKIYRRSAALEATSGAASIVPGAGTAASLAVDGAAVGLEARDRMALEEQGGSVLAELEDDSTLARSFKRCLRTVDSALRKTRTADDEPTRSRAR